ncbi:MAG: hypothetical protein FJ280_03410 [Planctomycetes bacterium]|nr:hypothetical protein [Planctomycetota bacterium]
MHSQFLQLRGSLLQVCGNVAIANAGYHGRSSAASDDYRAGSSHTLPTSRRTRFSSALTRNDFVKSISPIFRSPNRAVRGSASRSGPGRGP